jgi:hypothetical protein
VVRSHAFPAGLRRLIIAHRRENGKNRKARAFEAKERLGINPKTFPLKLVQLASFVR